MKYLKFNESNKSITFWNSYNRVLNNIPRTTNSIEEYLGHLNSLIHGKQNSIFLILSELKKEQSFTEQKLLMSLHADTKSINDDRLRTILEEYSTFYGLDYLKKIIIHYSWKLD
ncbi:hypothetical protein DMUE_0180 [Dictyocoela muelleri]|nr:hypothetical protein DMUE_0180 [Dictyocoela muelleri]